MKNDYIANETFNFLGMYAIKGLTNYDLTPDDDDGVVFTLLKSQYIVTIWSK